MAMGLYVHVPFCRVRCAYCDFAILAGQDRWVGEYLAAVRAELARSGKRWRGRRVDTLYFGGGTPSRLSPEALGGLVQAVEQAFHAGARVETSLEANPEDVTPETIDGWIAAGIDRVTLGVQSLDERVLAALGRPGSREESLAALDALLRSGLFRVGVDLIFGGPGQSLEGWLRELDEIIATGVGHLSCYALETTSPTPLVRRIERGEVPVASQDVMASMYEAAVARLERAGLTRYEVSNFARPGEQSAHNLKHWSDVPYLGIGLSAASYVDGQRWTNPRRLRDYLRMARGEADPPPSEPFDAALRAGEALVFGLRRPEGVDLSALTERYGIEAVASRREALDRAAERGLAIREGERLRLTDRGMLLGDEVFVELL